MNTAPNPAPALHDTAVRSWNWFARLATWVRRERLRRRAIKDQRRAQERVAALPTHLLDDIGLLAGRPGSPTA